MPPKRQRVLIIEDDVLQADDCAYGLRQEGMEVDVAYRGQDGLDLALVESHEAIILDLHLPDMHGLQVLRILRTVKLVSRAFVIVLTGDKDISPEVMRMADLCLHKPVTPRMLSGHIYQGLRQMPPPAEVIEFRATG